MKNTFILDQFVFIESVRRIFQLLSYLEVIVLDSWFFGQSSHHNLCL